MRGYSIVLSSAALCFFLHTLSAPAQDAKSPPAEESPRWYNPKRYNPLKLINRGPKSANDQLASNGDLEVKVTHQLQVQGILPQGKDLQDVCSSFKYLDECLASLRVSRTLQIDFPHSSRVLCGLRVSANNFFLHPPWTDFAIPGSHVVKARQGVTSSSRMSCAKQYSTFPVPVLH